MQNSCPFKLNRESVYVQVIILLVFALHVYIRATLEQKHRRPVFYRNGRISMSRIASRDIREMPHDGSYCRRLSSQSPINRSAVVSLRSFRRLPSVTASMIAAKEESHIRPHPTATHVAAKHAEFMGLRAQGARFANRRAVKKKKKKKKKERTRIAYPRSSF